MLPGHVGVSQVFLCFVAMLELHTFSCVSWHCWSFTSFHSIFGVSQIFMCFMALLEFHKSSHVLWHVGTSQVFLCFMAMLELYKSSFVSFLLFHKHICSEFTVFTPLDYLFKKWFIISCIRGAIVFYNLFSFFLCTSHFINQLPISNFIY